MPQIIITIEADSGHISNTQILAQNMQEEEYALDRLKLFLPALHKLRKSLKILIRLFDFTDFDRFP